MNEHATIELPFLCNGVVGYGVFCWIRPEPIEDTRPGEKYLRESLETTVEGD
jgi:hypothetical protein